MSNTNTFDPGPGKHVLFFGDPMCSWCWGFAPELKHIIKALKGRAKLHMVMGGLRPGTCQPWDPDLRTNIRHHWQDVEAATGQPFDYARFNDADFIYDTEPACRAVVTVRTLDPEAAPVFYEALQKAFYADGRDITQPATLTKIAATCGVDSESFAHDFAQPHMQDLTANDFSRSRTFSVSGFPTVICIHDGSSTLLAHGYRPYSTLKSPLEEWLNA